MKTCYIADTSVAHLGSDVLHHLRTTSQATTFDVHTHDGDSWFDPLVGVCDVDAAEAFAAAASADRVCYIVGHDDAEHPFPVAKTPAYDRWAKSI